MKEIKSHHKWFGVIFHYSRVFPRVLRIVSLATNVIIMLFIQSITYNLTHGDDGTCESFEDEVDCLHPTSAYSTGSTMCYWRSSDSTCHYLEPDSDLKVMIYVAIFSALVATPLAVFVDWLIINILVAPTKESGTNTPVVPGSRNAKTLTAIVPHNDDSGVNTSAIVNMKKHNNALRSTLFQEKRAIYEMIARREFNELTEELLKYRKQMTLGERKEFDGKSLDLFYLYCLN